MRLELLGQAGQGARVLGSHQEPCGPLVQAMHDAWADDSWLALARQPCGLRIQVSITICMIFAKILELSSPT